MTEGRNLMAVAQALVLTKPRTLEKRSIGLPAVTPETGLLRVEACGLCGTDHEQYTGHLPSHHALNAWSCWAWTVSITA